MAYAYVGTGGILVECGNRFQVTAKAGVSGEMGTLLAINGSNEVVLALATVGTALKACFVALHKFSGGEVVSVAKHCTIRGIVSGATPHAPAYLAEGTDSGKITETIPSTTGDVKSEIGRMADATTVAFDIPPPDQQVVA